MGKLTETMNEFSSISSEYYQKIQEILRDEYCWKCPMRSTSSKTNCREIDAWIRLTGAFENGIRSIIISEGISSDDLEVTTRRYLSKLLKKHQRPLNYEKTVVLKLKDDIEPYARKDDLLLVKENPGSVKADDLVLWPQICPVSFYWFSKTKITGIIPFKILKVEKIVYKGRTKFIEGEKKQTIPLEYLNGKIIKIIDKNDSKYGEFVL